MTKKIKNLIQEKKIAYKNYRNSKNTNNTFEVKHL